MLINDSAFRVVRVDKWRIEGHNSDVMIGLQLLDFPPIFDMSIVLNCGQDCWIGGVECAIKQTLLEERLQRDEIDLGLRQLCDLMQHIMQQKLYKSPSLSYCVKVLDDKVQSQHKLKAIDGQIQHRVVPNGLIAGRKDAFFDDLIVDAGADHALHLDDSQQQQVEGHQSLPRHQLHVVEGSEVASQKANQALHVALDQEQVAEIYADVYHLSIHAWVLSTEHSQVKGVDSYRQLQQKQLQEDQNLQSSTLHFLNFLSLTFLMRIEQLSNINSIVSVQAFILSYAQKLLFSIVVLVQLGGNEVQCGFVESNAVESDCLATEGTSKVSSDGFEAFPAYTMILRADEERFVLLEVVLIVADVAVTLRGSAGRVRSEIG